MVSLLNHMRLDQFLTQKTHIARHQIQKMIEQGGVKVNGRVVFKPAFKILGTENVDYELPKLTQPFSIKAQPLPIDVLYEDDQIVVVNKPSDLVIHPASGHPNHTLVNGLLYRYGSLPPTDDPLKPGIVHRLDKGTSGVMVVAKTDTSLKNLQRQFRNREVEKIYWAVVLGCLPAEGVIDKPLGRHPKRRQKISSHTRKPREALTKWRTIENFGPKFSLLEIQLHTGRTHQIRVHLTEAGHPLVGDPTYGRRNKIFSEIIERPCLHALRLKLTHPSKNERMFFEAALPEDFKRLLDHLKNAYPA